MIKAADFVEAARQRGFSMYCGVPCSYLKPFINYVIDDPELTYVSSANEGDAVATASGAALAGRRSVAMMQNSGLGNAVSPLTSLNQVFRLPVLLIVTWRGDPAHADEPQHELMGRITTAMLDTMEIPWAWFPDQPEQIGPALQAAVDCMDREQRPYCLVMRKGTVEPHPLRDSEPPKPSTVKPGLRISDGGTRRVSRGEALREMIAHSSPQDSVLIASTGYNGRELYAIEDRPNQLYMVGSMGCAASFGLGLSLALPELRVLVADGDGATLMRMGNLATIGTYGGRNLFHVLLDNGVHESTGGQATVSNNVDFAQIAHACQYGFSEYGDSLAAFTSLFGPAPTEGARFLHLLTRVGVADALPRPQLSPVQVKQRLMQHIGA